MTHRLRITFWSTSSLEPAYEAVSKEVFDLAGRFVGSRIFSVSPHLSVKLDRRARCYGFSARLDPLLRPVIRWMERQTDVNHVYAELMPWIFHKTLHRKPLVLTVTTERGEPQREFLERCHVIAVQTSGMFQRLQSLDFTAGRVRLIYPGIDLSKFVPRTAPPGSGRRPRILLATFPRAEHELESRGVHFLLDVASRCPHLDFHFLSRPWASGATALPATQALVRERGLTNVTISEGTQDMPSLYREHDFTVIAYTTVDGGKECPRSLIESLACGVPVLISDVAPFSAFVNAERCGCVFPLNPEGFAAAVEAGLSNYEQLSSRAASAAREHFDIEATVAAYAKIYEQLA